MGQKFRIKPQKTEETFHKIRRRNEKINERGTRKHSKIMGKDMNEKENGTIWRKRRNETAD
jgi:hypothetical protein